MTDKHPKNNRDNSRSYVSVVCGEVLNYFSITKNNFKQPASAPSVNTITHQKLLTSFLIHHFLIHLKVKFSIGSNTYLIYSIHK